MSSETVLNLLKDFSASSLIAKIRFGKSHDVWDLCVNAEKDVLERRYIGSRTIRVAVGKGSVHCGARRSMIVMVSLKVIG